MEYLVELLLLWNFFLLVAQLQHQTLSTQSEALEELYGIVQSEGCVSRIRF